MLQENFFLILIIRNFNNNLLILLSIFIYLRNLYTLFLIYIVILIIFKNTLLKLNIGDNHRLNGILIVVYMRVDISNSNDKYIV